MNILIRDLILELKNNFEEIKYIYNDISKQIDIEKINYYEVKYPISIKYINDTEIGKGYSLNNNININNEYNCPIVKNSIMLEKNNMNDDAILKDKIKELITHIKNNLSNNNSIKQKYCVGIGMVPEEYKTKSIDLEFRIDNNLILITNIENINKLSIYNMNKDIIDIIIEFRFNII